MSDQELIEQFQRCKKWNDPEQWEALAMAYYGRTLYDNAAYCFRQADEARKQKAKP
jgi:hypothetical protein